jgi:hypothetical protein
MFFWRNRADNVIVEDKRGTLIETSDFSSERENYNCFIFQGNGGDLG